MPLCLNLYIVNSILAPKMQPRRSTFYPRSCFCGANEVVSSSAASITLLRPSSFKSTPITVHNVDETVHENAKFVRTQNWWDLGVSRSFCLQPTPSSLYTTYPRRPPVSPTGCVMRVGLGIVRYQRDKKYGMTLENRLLVVVHTSVRCWLIGTSSESNGGKPHSSGTKASSERRTWSGLSVTWEEPTSSRF